MKSFKEFLTEGLIKLPEATRKALHDGIEKSLAMYAYWRGKDEVKEKAEETLKRLGVAPLKTMKGNSAYVFDVPVDISDLPAKYRKRAAKLPKKITAKVMMNLLKDDDGSTVEGLYDHEKLNQIKITIGSKRFVDNVIKANDPYEFKHEVEHAHNVADHELTHFIQDRVLQDVGVGVEFDPTIKTQLGIFKRLLQHNKDLGLENPRRSLDVFVGSKGEHAFWGSVTPSTFFMGLKGSSPDQWQKAVKIFTQNLNEGKEDQVVKSLRQVMIDVGSQFHDVKFKSVKFAPDSELIVYKGTTSGGVDLKVMVDTSTKDLIEIVATGLDPISMEVLIKMRNALSRWNSAQGRPIRSDLRVPGTETIVWKVRP